MRYTRSAMTKLTKMYRSVLSKCALLNASLIMGITLATPVNAAIINYTIDGRGSSSASDHRYTSGYAANPVQSHVWLSRNGWDASPSKYTDQLYKWQWYNSDVITLSGGIFRINDLEGNNGLLYATGGILAIQTGTFSLRDDSYINEGVSIDLNNGTILSSLSPYSSLTLSNNDNISAGTLMMMFGSLKISSGTHILDNNSWIATPVEFKMTGGTLNITNSAFGITVDGDDDISGGTINATGGNFWIENDQTLQHNSAIADAVTLEITSGKTLTLDGNATVNVNEGDSIDGAIMNIADGTLSFNGDTHNIYNNTISGGTLAVTNGHAKIHDTIMTGGIIDITGGEASLTSQDRDTEITSNGIGIQTANGTTLNLKAKDNRKLILNSEMSLAGTTNLEDGEILLGTNQAATSFANAADLNIFGGTLSFANNNINTTTFTNTIKNSTAFNLILDIDANGNNITADKIVADLSNNSPVYLSALNFINDSAASGDVTIAEGELRNKLVLSDNADTGIYVTASYNNSDGVLHFADPITWAKRTNGSNSIYKWTKDNTSIIPVAWAYSTTPTTLYVNILKKNYIDNTHASHDFQYTWNDSTKRLNVTNNGGSPLSTTTGTRSGTGSAASPFNYSGDYIGKTSTGAIVIVGTDIKTDTIVGDFVGNTSNTDGGAIRNSQASINSIVGNFIGNSVNEAYKYGGAIYNGSSLTGNKATIGSITGDFIGNYASFNGGAVFNESHSGYNSEINSISGDFIGNTSGGNGGAITNFGTINSIKGNFIDNTASGSGGGAIFNSEGGTLTAEGQFIANTATTGSGGAVYNNATINLSGDFINNKASFDGGAVYTTGSGTTNILDSSFIGNSAPQGAAIYVNNGTANVTAKTKDIEFTNNNTTGTAGSDGDGIYNRATLNLNTAENKNITINDKVSSTGTININTDENNNSGTVIFNNEVAQTGTTNINGGTLKIGTGVTSASSNLGSIVFSNGATLDLVNNSNQTLDVASLKGNGNLKIDFNNTSNDIINATSSETGTITLTALNGLTKGTAVTAKTILGNASNITLDVSPELRQYYDILDQKTEGYDTDPIESTADWTDSFKDRYYQMQTGLQLVVDNSTAYKKLSYAETTGQKVYNPTKDISLGDTLALVNQKTDTTRSFTTSDATATYTVTNALGATAIGTMTVQGATDGTNTSTINMNSQDGFTVGSGATLALNTVNITGTKDANSSFINNTNGTVLLENIGIEENNNNIITNAATLNLSGTNNILSGINGTGTTTVTGGKTVINSLSQNTVAISGGELEVANLTTSTPVSNNGILSLTGTSNANTISGSGTTVIKSTGLNNTALINQDVEVNNGAKIKSDIAKLGGTITNNGQLLLSGNLSKAITGTGTTKVDTSLTMLSSASINGTLDMNGSTLSLIDTTPAYTNYSVGKLMGSGNLEINFNGSSTDSITASASETGTITITALNGFDGTTITPKTILSGASNITLAVSDALKATYNQVTITGNGYDTDAITSTATWADEFKKRYYDIQTGKQFVVNNSTANKTLAYEETSQNIYDPTKDVSLGDTLALVNQKDDTTRSFTTTDATATYTVTDTLGTTAAGTMTIQGASDGNSISTLNMNGQNGFTVGSGATLALDTVNIIDTKNTGGSFINNTNGTVSLKDIYIAPNKNNTITNDATLNLSGTNYILTGINGNGITNILNGETIATHITQDKVIIGNDVIFTANANNIDANIENNGTYSVSGGTISKNVTGGTFNVYGDVTLGSGANLTTTTTTVADGASFDVGTQSINLGNATINGTLKLSITDMAEGSTTYTGGQINADTLNLGNTSALSLTIAPNLIKKDTSTGALNLINVSTSTTGEFAQLLSNNRYKVTADGNGKFIITNYASAEDIIRKAGGTRNNIATGVAWDELTASGGSTASYIQNILNDLSQHDAQAYTGALTNLTPTDSMAIAEVTQDFNNLIGEQIATRLDEKGMSSGDVFENQGAWVQMLYNHSQQNDSHNNQGFTGKTAGVAFGLDGKVDDKLTIGLGYAYGQTDIDSYGRDTDVDGHTIYAYGKYQPSQWFVRGMVNYGIAKYDEKAIVAEITNKAKYDVYNYGARTFIGYDFANGFTPETGLKFTHIDRESYKDTIGQRINDDNMDILTASLGLKYSKNIVKEDYIFKPKARIATTYDLISDDTNAIVNIETTSYNIKGDKLHRFGIESGIGAEIDVGNWTFSAEYDLGVRKDYTNHTGMLKAKYNF